MFTPDNIQQIRKYVVWFVTTLCIIILLVVISISVHTSIDNSLNKIHELGLANDADEDSAFIQKHYNKNGLVRFSESVEVTTFTIPLIRALIAPAIAIIFGIGASLLSVLLHRWRGKRAIAEYMKSESHRIT
jgi:hypothetical protein